MANQTLSGKRVVVLGGTSGFGLATAKAAALAGAEVIIGSRSKANIEKALQELPEGVQGASIDVSDEASLKSYFDGLGGLDHLVYTAGDGIANDLSTTAAARKVLEIRFWGAYMASRAAFPHIRPGGSITLTTGIVGARPWKGWSVVGAGAGALEALTRGLALEMAPIRVNAVCAGVVKTALWSGMSEVEREAFYADSAKKLPVGRVGEVEDVAETYLYLMQSGFTTGQIVVIDGGALIV
jgi:NAD(P)-dependent dehydrogenase (short-subunit alcohol dehydrogenase family)